MRTALQSGGCAVYFQPIVNVEGGEADRLRGPGALAASQARPDLAGRVRAGGRGDGLIVALGDFVLHEVAGCTASSGRREFPERTVPMGAFANVSPHQPPRPTSARADGLLHSTRLWSADLADARSRRARSWTTTSPRQATIVSSRGWASCSAWTTSGPATRPWRRCSRFPFASLKIDGYFIEAITEPDHPAPVTTAIVGLGRALGVTVIAERVETAVQLERLRSLGCDAGQGYLFARPSPRTHWTPSSPRRCRTPAAPAAWPN